MAQSNLGRKTEAYSDGLSSIVIIKDLGDIPAGRTLDVSGVASGTEVIKSGHIIMKTAAGEYAPVGVSGNAYAALPEGASYVGVLKHSVLVSDPRAAILTMGQVNAAASPYPVTSEIKTALSHIQFLY